MSRLLVVLTLLLLLAPATAEQAPPGADAPLRVGIAEHPPFASRGDDGSWQGLSVNVWRTAAGELDLDYAFVPMAEDDLVGAVRTGRLDAALPVLATPEAAARVQLTFPIYTATLGVAEQQRVRVLDVAKSLLSWRLLQIVLSLSALLLVVGAIVWLLERRSNDDQFHRSPVRGLGDGFWWAGVTLTTIGYGDKAPATLGGRAVAMLWMLIGLAVSAALTAAVVSAVGTGGGPGGDLAGYAEGKRVAIVGESGAAAYLDGSGTDVRRLGTLDEALDLLSEGEVDMLVHPAPGLKSAAPGTLRVTTTRAEPFGVTFALQDGSPLADPLERAIVARVTAPSWWDHVERWVPPDDQ